MAGARSTDRAATAGREPFGEPDDGAGPDTFDGSPDQDPDSWDASAWDHDPAQDPTQDQDRHTTATSQTDEDDEGPSKSAIKREHLALQDLAEQLVGLPRADLLGLDLSERTWVAIDETARVKDRKALRRHYKRIANCLARENTEPLTALLTARDAQGRAATARHHATARWRERLIAEGDAALTEFFDAHPDADRQHLRQLVRDAQRDTARGRPEAPRRLFRALRTLLAEAPDA